MLGGHFGADSKEATLGKHRHHRAVAIALAACAVILGFSALGQPAFSEETRYRSSWVEQSPYLTLAPGTSAGLWVRLRNTGTETWYRDGETPTRLGTARPEDRPSAFYTPSDWLAPNRIGLSEEVVRPSEVGTFAFTVTAPSQPGIYREYFRPVVDGVTWMNDEGIYWDLVVRGQQGPGMPWWPSPGTPPGLDAAPETRGAWIFQTGTDADGQPIPYTGGMMMRTSCANCHGRDGRGLRTGMFISLDITYRNLTDPAGMLEPDGERGPTYTDALIRRAVQQGLDAEGRQLDLPMPRSLLSDRQWEDLLTYLKTLP